MISLNDAALVMGLTAVVVALWGWPRSSLALSGLSVFYTVWGLRLRRWRRETEGD